MTERHRHADVLVAIAEGRAVEYYSVGGGWYTPNDINKVNPFTESELTWRVKPKVRTPRRIWVNEYDNDGFVIYDSLAEANKGAGIGRRGCTEYIEVLEEQE